MSLISKTSLAAIMILGMSALSHTPAQAGGGSVQFGLSFGNGNAQIHIGNRQDRRHSYYLNHRKEKQLRRALRRQGYYNIRFIEPIGRGRYHVTADMRYRSQHARRTQKHYSVIKYSLVISIRNGTVIRAQALNRPRYNRNESRHSQRRQKQIWPKDVRSIRQY